MKQKTLDFLEAHKSEQHSTLTEDAKWRQENEVWLKWSRGIALSIVAYMQANSLSRSDIANKLGVSPQYVSRILSGTTNFSFKSIAEIERKLGISCMEAAMAWTILFLEVKQFRSLSNSSWKWGNSTSRRWKMHKIAKSCGNFVVNLQLNVLNICTQETYKLRALIFLYIFAQQNMIMAINLSSQW